MRLNVGAVERPWVALPAIVALRPPTELPPDSLLLLKLDSTPLTADVSSALAAVDSISTTEELPFSNMLIPSTESLMAWFRAAASCRWAR